jgi:ABC-type nitrate/sulfonate/bicarbonate transport system substrate-binding protein
MLAHHPVTFRVSSLAWLCIVLCVAGVACAAPSAPAAATAAPTPALAIGSAAGSADAPTSGGDASGPTMKIAYASPALAGLPYYAAITQGFFAQQHVNVQLVRLAPNAAVAALIQGEIDASNSPDTTLIAATRGFSAKVVLSLWKQAPWTIMGKTDITSIQGLKGRSVGTNQVGSGPYVYLKAGLERAGMSIDDVKVVSSPGTQDTFTLLANGQVDAAVVSPPFDTQAEMLGLHEVAFIGDAQESPYIGLGTTDAFIRDHRPVLVSVIRALMDANAWLKAHPEGAADLGVRYVGVEPAASLRAAQKAIPQLSDTGEASLTGIQQSIDQQSAVGNVQRIAAQSVVDFSPLHEALH